MNPKELSALLKMSFPYNGIPSRYHLDGFTAFLSAVYTPSDDTYYFTFNTNNGNESKFDSHNPIPHSVRGYLRSMYNQYLDK